VSFAYHPERDSLTAILAMCGYTHRKAPMRIMDTRGRREVLNAAGEVVFTGAYEETLGWLLFTGQAVERSQEAAE
jgi:hypothetical protein